MLHTQERNFTKKKIFFEKQLLEQKKNAFKQLPDFMFFPNSN